MGLRNKDLTRVEGPALEHWSLKNGTRCVIATMPDSPLTCLDFWCKAGSYSENSGEEGLAHFLEHMIFKGSSLLNEGEFDLKIEALGGSSNAATGFDDVHFHVLIPSDSAISALELLLNLVLEPTLKAEAFSREREVVLEEIAQYKDQPDEQIFQTLLENCWRSHSYGRSILGFESSLKISTPKQMRDFHQRNYKSDNCCLAIAGAIPKEIRRIISESKLSELISTQDNEVNLNHKNLISFTKGRKEIKVPRLESSRLLMAWPMLPAKNQSMVLGADIATTLLAEGRCSRLVQRLREELQLVESIDMDITVLEKGSLILLEACCKEEHLNQVENEVHKMLRQSLSSEPTERELTRASQLVKNGLCFSLEAPNQIAGLAASNTLWDRPQPLLSPLKYFDYWNGSKIQSEIFNLLQPERSFSLIATPKGDK